MSSSSKEFLARVKDFKNQGFLAIREIWGSRNEIKIGEKNKDGFTCIKIEWPANDKDDKEMRFPKVYYKWDEIMKDHFEKRINARKL